MVGTYKGPAQITYSPNTRLCMNPVFAPTVLTLKDLSGISTKAHYDVPFLKTFARS
jgi:hypothetical protein